MRLWPFHTEREVAYADGDMLDRLSVVEDLLRRNVEDVFRVERQEVRGATYAWGGTLLVAPARALALIEARFRPFGYTPFFGRQGDLTWIRAVPLAQVGERLFDRDLTRAHRHPATLELLPAHLRQARAKGQIGRDTVVLASPGHHDLSAPQVGLKDVRC